MIVNRMDDSAIAMGAENSFVFISPNFWAIWKKEMSTWNSFKTKKKVLLISLLASYFSLLVQFRWGVKGIKKRMCLYLHWSQSRELAICQRCTTNCKPDKTIWMLDCSPTLLNPHLMWPLMQSGAMNRDFEKIQVLRSRLGFPKCN